MRTPELNWTVNNQRSNKQSVKIKCKIVAQILSVEKEVIVFGTKLNSEKPTPPCPHHNGCPNAFLAEGTTPLIFYTCSPHLTLTLNTANCVNLAGVYTDVATECFLWNPQTVALLAWYTGKAYKTGRKIKKYRALEIVLFQRHMLFPVHFLREGCRERKSYCVDGSNSLQTMTKTIGHIYLKK